MLAPVYLQTNQRAHILQPTPPGNTQLCTRGASYIVPVCVIRFTSGVNQHHKMLSSTNSKQHKQNISIKPIQPEYAHEQP